MSYTRITLEETEIDVSMWKNPDSRLITIYLTKAVHLEFPLSKMKQLLNELRTYDELKEERR